MSNGDTVFVTDGTIIANDENYTVLMSGGNLRSLLVSYGQIIGHGFATLYMGAGSSVLENHGLIRNNDDSLNERPAVLIGTEGTHRIVNNGDISSAGRVLQISTVGPVSLSLQNHGLMQALYGHDMLRDAGYLNDVTVENSGILRGGAMALSGSGETYLDNSGVMEITSITAAAAYGLTLLNTGTIEGWETSFDYLADPGAIWIAGSVTADQIRNEGSIRGDLDVGEGDDVVHNSGQWVGDLLLGYGNDTLNGFGGRFDGVIDGGPGDDRIAVDDSTVALRGGDGSDTVIARADVLDVDGVELIWLLGADDLEVAGSGEAEQITGNFGGNYLSGAGGDDTINGGPGDDVILGGDGADSLIGGSGRDELTGDAGADRITGGAGNDLLYGGAGDDVLSGEDGADYIEGGDGEDILSGAFGNDTLLGGGENDYIVGQGNDDYIDAGEGDDVGLGGDGADTILGGAGRDTLSGDAGADVIQGGTGYDILIGKSGADTFVFDSVAEIDDGISDRIKDFEPGLDVIDVSGIDEEASFDFLGTAGFTGGGGMEIRYVMNSFGAALVYFDEDGDATSDGRLILLNVPNGVVADDFLL